MRWTRESKAQQNTGTRSLHPDEGLHWIELGPAVVNYFLGQKVKTWKDRQNYEDGKTYEIIFIDLKRGRMQLRRIRNEKKN